MTMDAALPVSQQWERDLAELLGLDGAASRHAPPSARRAGMMLFVLALVVVTAAVAILVARRWAVPMAVQRPAIVRALPHRPTPAPAPAVRPAPLLPVADTTSAARTTRGERAERIVRLKRVGRAGREFAVRRSHPSAVIAARRTSSGHASSPAVGHSSVALSSPAREAAGPSTDDRHRPAVAERSPPDGGRGSLWVPREAATTLREARNDPPSQAMPPRADPGAKRQRGGKIEALDAIRSLRRQ